MILRLAILLLAAPLAAQTPAAKNACEDCHGAEAKAFRECVHRNLLTCTDCHGGDPQAMRDKKKSHAEAAGYRGVPTRRNIPELCGKCHSDPVRMHASALPTDQLEHYRNSEHGKALFGRGDERAAICTDCHGTHRILPSQDPESPTARVNLPATCGACHADAARMEPHGIPADIVDRFRAGVHGHALLVERTRGAPSCADCHGSHGATPPGARDVVQVCGQCHLETAEHYRKSPHFASGEMRCDTCHEEEKGPRYRRSDCTVCHNPHEVQASGEWLYAGDEPDRCTHCHREPGEVGEATEAILGGRRVLREAMAETREQIKAGKQRGLFVEHEHLFVRDSARVLVSVQPLAHSLDLEAISKHFADGRERQQTALEELRKKSNVLRDRRIILIAVAALLLLLGALLGLKLQAVRRLS